MELWKALVEHELTKMSAGGDKWEYVNTITFTEDGRFAMINTDAEGNPFELKKFAMFGRNAPSSLTTVSAGTVYVLGTLLPDIVFEENAEYNICSNGALSSSLVQYWGAYYEVKIIEEGLKDGGKMVIIDGMKSPLNHTLTDVPEDSRGFRSLGVFTSTAKAYFGAGSVIDIYGVKV